jgi:hypothetical protein
MLSGDALLTAMVSVGALLAVWVPFYRGLRVFFDARSATRRITGDSLRRALRDGTPDSVPPIALQMLRLLARALRENESGHPRDFLVDATRQYVVNEYDASYARRISMYSNLLPPIGFIGTTGGLLILFFSMHASNASLELGALALALTSSIFALMGFAVLEGLKIGLYGRLLTCLGDALQVATSRDARGEATTGSAPANAPAV